MRDALSGAGLRRSTYVGKAGLIARKDLGGLNLASVPTVFVEAANMRNAADAALVKSTDFRQKLAEALARGIEQFLTR